MTRGSWQHTKVVCTLGPATDAPGVLEALIRDGMDLARINMSHGAREDHTRRIQSVREASRILGQPVGILVDLPGPKFRIGAIDGGARKLDECTRVYLAEEASGPDFLPIRHRALLDALRPGESVFLADGSIELRVTATAVGRVECKVLAGGTVRSGSGVNVPELDLPALVPTEYDRICLEFAASQAVEWIGVSFVQSADDLARVRAGLAAAHQPLLMAKIEKRRALTALDAIVEAADGIMVARGDLGVETDLAQIPLVQKHIIAAANAAVGFAACQLAEQLDARAIIAHVQTLAQVATIARFRPQQPIVALTESAVVCRSLTLVSGTAPLRVPPQADAQARITRARDWPYVHALARPGDQAVVVSASAGVGETADTLHVLRLP